MIKKKEVARAVQVIMENCNDTFDCQKCILYDKGEGCTVTGGDAPQEWVLPTKSLRFLKAGKE